MLIISIAHSYTNILVLFSSLEYICAQKGYTVSISEQRVAYFSDSHFIYKQWSKSTSTAIDTVVSKAVEN